MSKVRPIPLPERESDSQHLRIGELARRAALPTATVRAWERRYGVLNPARSEAGYRLYSESDERVLRRMVGLVEAGLAPAEAARRVRSEEPAPAAPAAAEEVPVAGLRDALAEAVARFDDREADRVLDRAVTVLSTQALLEEVLLPVLRGLESRTVGQEHFASSLIRGRMLALARGWGGGEGRQALLACPGGELHDLGLIAFGLALRDRGWRIAFLGANTPIDSLRAAAEVTEPEVVVLFSMRADLYDGWDDELASLRSRSTLMLGGPGAGEALCSRLGAVRLEGGPIEEAAAVG